MATTLWVEPQTQLTSNPVECPGAITDPVTGAPSSHPIPLVDSSFSGWLLMFVMVKPRVYAACISPSSLWSMTVAGPWMTSPADGAVATLAGAAIAADARPEVARMALTVIAKTLVWRRISNRPSFGEVSRWTHGGSRRRQRPITDGRQPVSRSDRLTVEGRSVDRGTWRLMRW